MISLTDGGNLSAQAPALHMFVLLVHENGGEMTLNRIVVVSMVRNEEDIIESFVRWHCYQAFVSQLFLFFVNTTTFWWTVSIVLGSNLVTNAYIAWLIIAFIFNIYEIIGTFYSAIKIRKGEHLSWWFYGDIVDLIVKK